MFDERDKFTFNNDNIINNNNNNGNIYIYDSLDNNNIIDNNIIDNNNMINKYIKIKFDFNDNNEYEDYKCGNYNYEFDEIDSHHDRK